MYLISKCWSAFSQRIGKNHSTETALLYVISAVKRAMDKTQGTILLLVDFSSAFDTIDHNILIRRLRLRYGFVGKALDWVISYLKERTQRVVIDDQHNYSNERCPARLCLWTTVVFVIRLTYRWHHTSPWTILPSICRWFTGICSFWLEPFCIIGCS